MNEEIREQMNINYFKMKNLKASYTTIMLTDITILFAMLIFTFLGGFVPFLIGADLMIIITFYCGHQLFEKRKLLWGIMILNIAAVLLYLILQPFSELFVRLVICTHLLMALEMYLFLRLGKQKEELSCELGYPYFTEMAFYRQEFRGYKQQNDISAGTENMDVIISEQGDALKNAVYKRDDDPEMDYIDESEISVKNNIISDYKIQNEEYNKYYHNLVDQANEAEKKEEIDIGLLKLNNRRMKSFKREQGVLFLLDAVMMIVALTKAVDGLASAFMVDPLYIFMVFNVFAVASASLITVTCLDNDQISTSALYSYLATGLFFAFIMDYSFPFSYPICALQMLYVKKLSDDDRYLKSQKGYPYFSEAMLRHQSNKSKYTSQYDVRLQSSKNEMDKI